MIVRFMIVGKKKFFIAFLGRKGKSAPFLFLRIFLTT